MTCKTPELVSKPALVCGVAAVFAAGVLVHAAGSIRIVPIVRGQSVVVSVELADTYTAEVRDAFASGLRTNFIYNVDLRMAVPAWVDRTIAMTTVEVRDQYDNLTRLHNLVRVVDGRVVEALVTDQEPIVKRWLTSLSAVPICPTSLLERDREYYVRISARTRPPGASWLGLTDALTGQAKFTFVP